MIIPPFPTMIDNEPMHCVTYMYVNFTKYAAYALYGNYLRFTLKINYYMYTEVNSPASCTEYINRMLLKVALTVRHKH